MKLPNRKMFVHLLLIWVLTSVASLSLGQSPKPKEVVEYLFEPSSHTKVTLWRGEKWHVGFLDGDGEFVTTQVLKGLSVPFELPPFYHFPSGIDEKGELVYEYRSGQLVKGTLNWEGNFVPEAGSRVISLKDYHHGKDALRIYNLPGRFVAVKKSDKKGAGGSSAP
jgi:hypothetical protein